MQAICLVSADRRIQRELESVLVSHGLGVTVFESAGSYLASRECAEGACVILDTDLPDMSGSEVQEQVADSGTPVVFATRREDLASTVRAMAAGAVDYLIAPFNPVVFMRAVRAAMELARIQQTQRHHGSDMRERFERLTLREQQVFRCLISGLQNKQVAGELGISEVTVQVHRRRVMHKMGVLSFADLVRIATSLSVAPVRRALAPAHAFRRGRQIVARHSSCQPPPSARNTLT